ncbi:MAG: CoA transferase [Dehalococcoidales bacterium]|jgi:crotonobetainyl-CoA:carnitine CoA-transferase CaiB-like acyl-CoA transferase
MLSCYRILDLTTEKAFIAGRALSDFGAEVIKVESPGGDPARFRGLFYQDRVDPEKNLTWLAFNANKKSVTLDITTPQGKETFLALVKTADAVLESYAPGYLDSLGLGYKDLSAVNPGIVLTSISGFGQAGPYKDYKDPDIVVRALGGMVYTAGYDDRPPLTTSYEHTHTLGAMNGAAGTVIALIQRAHTGRGQHVDAVTQQALDIVCSAEIEGPYALFGQVPARHGRARASVTLKDGSTFYNTLLWPCKDGFIALNLLLNPTAAKNNHSMMEYLKKDGIDIGFLEGWDWEKKSWEHMTREQAEKLMDSLGKFFNNHTKDELLKLAIENRFQLGPCNNAADILKHPQLAARNFWKEIDHPEIGKLKFPGGAVVSSEKYVGPQRRAPHIGEHNDEILKKLNARISGAKEKTPVGANKKPFEGIKLVQLCWAGVGVYTCNYLSHYGATTIRVETATRPDPVRLFAPFAATNKPGEALGLERSAFFSITHTAPEMDIALNFKTAEGVAIFKKLVAWADVVAEGFPAGVMDKLGLDYEGLKKINPDIIMFRTCGYGHTGPMADQPGFGSILTAVTMMDNIVGWPDRAPVPPSTYYTDQLSPMYASLSIMAALDYRRRTGKGQYIDHSQVETGINYMTPLILDYQANGREFRTTGNKSGHAAPHGIYRCQGDDRWAAIAVTSDDEWRSFVKAIGGPGWAKDRKYASAADRLKYGDELDKLVEAWTLQYPPEAVETILQSAGVGAGTVADARDIDEDPQMNYYNFYREIDHPYMGRLRYYHPAPIKLSGAETAVGRPVLVGEHTDYICTRVLGMSQGEVDGLREKGVFQ